MQCCESNVLSSMLLFLSVCIVTRARPGIRNAIIAPSEQQNTHPVAIFHMMLGSQMVLAVVEMSK